MSLYIVRTQVALLAVIALSFSTSGQSSDPPLVTLPQVGLAGSFEGDLRVFKGIPCALPPKDECRWKPPMPSTPWQGNGWATERMVRQQSEHGHPSYLYLFDHCYPAAKERNLCALHASDVPYVFGQVGPDAALPANWPRPEGAGEMALSAAMLDYWVSFASTGRPNSDDHPRWSPYSNDQSYMHFSVKPIPSSDPISGMFEMQETIVDRRRHVGEQWFVNVGVAAPVPPDSSDGSE